jgi:hypothetical protein
MNEKVWLTEPDPLALLAELYPMGTHGSERPQSRRCRMYLLACARRQWYRLPGVCRAIVSLGETYADAPNQRERLRAAVALVAEQLMHSEGEPADLLGARAELLAAGRPDVAAALRDAGEPSGPLPPEDWRGLAALLYLPFVPGTPPFAFAPRRFHSRRLLHETHGNPCRHLPVRPEWRTFNVMGVARRIYATRDFGAMPILADALQDAGCDEPSILDHCREPNQAHVLGCWVLDLILDLR